MLDNFFDDKKTMLDNLTKLFLRDVIVQYTEYLIKENIPFTFGILDIDNFKHINDSYGHLVGDEVLQIVSKSLLNVVIERKGVIGRYGGDEFIFVFPNVTEYDDTWHIGYDVLKSSNKLELDNNGSFAISYTMGLSRFPLNGKNIDDIFEVADKALYRGKMKGRNCFIIYLPEKHSNIDLKSKRDKINSPIYTHSKIYSLIEKATNVDDGIKEAIDYLGTCLMIDHLCIETENELLYEYVHPISTQKSGFERLGYEAIGDMTANSGIFYENTVLLSKLLDSNKLLMTLAEQEIHSEVLCEIRVKNSIYGYLRCDMVSMDTGRIWQQEDLVTIQFTAMIIGLMLEVRGK